MLKVLRVVDSLDPGGAERHVVDLSCELARRGISVHVACSVGGVLANELERAGIWWVPLMPALVKRRACGEFAARLGRLLRRGGYQLVHAHMHASTVAAAQACRGSASALVVTEHTEAPWRTADDRRAGRQAFRRAQVVLAVSTPIVELLRTEYGLPAGRVRLVSPAVTPQRVPPAARPAPWRTRPLIGRVGRLQPEKGVDVFLQAAALVSRRLPRALFPVVGDGPLAGELAALVTRLGLDGNVALLGHRSNARAIIGMLDVLAVSSRSDGAPLVVLEALSAGVPVVASAVGGVPDQIGHDREGLLVLPDDPAALAAGIVRVTTEPELASRLRCAALRRAGCFSFTRMVDAIESTYTDALRAAEPDPGTAQAGA